MRIGIKMTICGILMAVAVTMAVFTLADFSPDETLPQTYVLGEAQGRVAVYGGSGKEPLTVTDIELAGLREADRLLLREGLCVSSHEELMALLEDLGS